MPASEDAGLSARSSIQAGGSRPGAGGLGLDTVALLRELQKRNISPQSAAAGAVGLSNPFETVTRAAVKTEEPSAKRLKEGSPMKGFGSVLLGSSGNRLPPSLQASLSELGLPCQRELRFQPSRCLSCVLLASLEGAQDAHQARLWGYLHFIACLPHTLDKCMHGATEFVTVWKPCNSVSSTKPWPAMSSLAGTLQVPLN